MPGLEGGVRVAFFFVDQSRLRRPGQNSCLPRTLKALPHQRVPRQRRYPVPLRPLLPNHPLRYRTAQVPGHRCNAGKHPRNHDSPISPRSPRETVTVRFPRRLPTSSTRAHVHTLQRGSFLIAQAASGQRLYRVTLEEYDQPYVILTGSHGAGRDHHQTTP